MPQWFSPISAPTLTNGSASGAWPITVPHDAIVGENIFSLSCGLPPATTDIDPLTVLDANSQTCCGIGPSAGKVWNGTACVLPPPPVSTTPSGAISANPNPCTIAYDASNCTSTITWSTQNVSAANANVRLDYATNFAPNIPNGTQTFPYVAKGGNIFELRDGTTVLASTTVSGVCVNTTGWDGSKCACPVGKMWSTTSSTCIVSLTPSGTISASPATCVILPDASYCRATTTITWSTANVTNGNATVEKTNVAETVSTTALSGSALRNMISGSTLFRLWNTGPNPDVLLSSATVLASCSGGSTWVASPAPGARSTTVLQFIFLPLEHAMSTTTIRLTDSLKARVTDAAARAGTSTHSFILEAIAEKTSAAEQQQSFLADADTRYAAIVKTGRTIAWDEMRQYLSAKIAGDKPTRPRAKKGL